jgi:hypothetical protein
MFLKSIDGRAVNSIINSLAAGSPARAPSVRWRAGRGSNAPATFGRHHEAALMEIRPTTAPEKHHQAKKQAAKPTEEMSGV